MESLENIITYLKNKDELKTAHLLLSTLQKYKEINRDTLAMLFHDIKSYPEALEITEDLYTSTVDSSSRYNIRCNLIKMYNETNQPLKALKYIKQNLAIKQQDVDMLMEMNFSYFLMNQKDKSEEILRNLLKEHFNPTSDVLLDDEHISKIKFNLGTYDLYHGDFQGGLRNFLLEGKKIGIWKSLEIPEHLIVSDTNPILPSDKVLVFAEGGIGDEFINLRFLKDKPNFVWCTSRADIVKICEASGINAVHESFFGTKEGQKELETFTKVMYSMTLPIFLNATPVSLEAGRYINYKQKNIELPGKKTKMKIGLRWSGNPYYEQNLFRSIEFNELYENVKNKYPDAELYSFQYPKEDINMKDVHDLSELIHDFEDTLELLDSMDLVITSCTSIAHAAGALQKPTIVFAPIAAYYTWCLNLTPKTTVSKSPWYNSITVIHQTEPKSWKEAFRTFQSLL